ncbi:hypothetical protein PZB75_18135 [Streptomyces sp. AM 4-1-1]|uniref:hypothetical protein n=1 Tax=Streptomyces sp. AM 4-1-1 TaxID=3028710 RepID=UPI0023B96D94|nr:hypothetical protein [Streptomyces sp. AM 4-1-1]WEH35108.1 hypothetical protein PZB75_18135 [Streptomyces sp. AM 4-1-1]
MTDSPWCPEGTVLVGDAVVDLADPGKAPRRIPSTYADPVAWMMADAVAAALDACGADAPAELSEVAVIGISEHATRHTLRAVAAGVPAGRMSPMRFAAAGPGSLVGVVCAVFGFQGPTLMLPMPVADAAVVTRAMITDWLTGDAASAAHVVVVTHECAEDGRHRARCFVLGRRNTTRGSQLV